MGKKKSFLRSIAKILVPPIGYLFFRWCWYSSKKNFHLSSALPQGTCLVASWHEVLMFTPQVYRTFFPRGRAWAIVSQHFDGELIARILRFFKIDSLRGSSSKGGVQVLREALRSLKNKECILLTPDGPRGPRHTLSNGIIALHQKTKTPIVTIYAKPKRYWRLNSWDRFVIPKPFTVIDIYIDCIEELPSDPKKAQDSLRELMLSHFDQHELENGQNNAS